MAKTSVLTMPVDYSGTVTMGRALKPGSFVRVIVDGRKVGRAHVQPDGTAEFKVPDGLVGRVFKFECLTRSSG